jgi:Peptidase family M28/PA domain
MKKLLFIVLILRGPFLVAQQANPTPFANMITPEELRSYLAVLTADSLEGRETGTIGNVKAGDYIARQFEKMGLPKIGSNGTHLQRMVYTNESWNQLGMSINAQTYRHLFNFYAFPGTNPLLTDKKINASEVVFLGYGIDDAAYSDYKNVDVKGKIILINQGEPLKKDSMSLLTKSTTPSVWTTDRRKKLETAFQKGVKAVLIIDPKLAQNIQEYRRFFARNIIGDVEKTEGVLANNIYISPDVAKEIIGESTKNYTKARQKCEKGKPRSVVLPCNLKITMDKFFNQLIGSNVLGYIEGSDPILKNELVVVSAHYDHLGKRNDLIYHGADDDGSGTSGVINIARAFSEAKKQGVGPRRSVLCMLVTGEEKGLLGSKYYTTNPIFPLEKTVADVNIDMIGRVDEKYEKANNPNYIYVIGSDKLSSDLHKINEDMNAKYTKLTLDYTYNDENDPNRYYYRSDHYNFAEQGIPVVFYFNGTHADYHQPTDTIDKINFEKMSKIAKLAFYTTWEIANRDERLKVDSKKK